MSERIACGDKIGIFRRTEEMVHIFSDKKRRSSFRWHILNCPAVSGIFTPNS